MEFKKTKTTNLSWGGVVCISFLPGCMSVLHKYVYVLGGQKTVLDLGSHVGAGIEPGFSGGTSIANSWALSSPRES